MTRSCIGLMIFSEAIGGAEAVVKQIAQHVDPSRYDYLLITNEEIKDYYQETPVHVVSVGALYGRSRLARFRRVLRRIGWAGPSALARLQAVRDRLLQVIDEHDIKLIHSHLLADHYVASLLPSDRVVRMMTMHGGLGLDIQHRCFLDKSGVVAVMNQATFLTSACQYFLDLLSRNGVDVRERSAIIENGIDAGILAEPESPCPANRDGALKMLFQGGDRYAKGGDLLAKALSIVVNERRQTNVHLTVLRNVHRRSEMYRCIQADGLKGFVDFVGYVPNRGHLRYIEAADLFVQPSRSEGVANALMEAIGLGKAVLATDVGGTREVVSHGVNGYLCRPSPDSIADGIVCFLKDPGALGRFARKNAELRSRFLWPAIVGKYEDLYERLLVRG